MTHHQQLAELQHLHRRLTQVDWPKTGCPWACNCDAARFFRAAYAAIPDLAEVIKQQETDSL